MMEVGGPSEPTTGTTCDPCVIFEGFEKRLELDFVVDLSSEFRGGLDWNGLRGISRTELNNILTAAQCTIVSQLSNNFCDSYVLSESSLFVYPLKIVLKTCGRTQLLLAITPLLEAASQVQLKVERCKYTRGSFIFPSLQPYPHGNFRDEVDYLRVFFKHLGSGGKAYVEGTLRQWHIYMAAASDEYDFNPESFMIVQEPAYTLEMCMTELNKSKAQQFFNQDGSRTGEDMTKASGIDEIFPNAEVCDFSFNPCGYSMNTLELSAHSTIHVTPEDGHSYASFECMGYGPRDVNLQTLLDKVARVFEPLRFSVALQVSNGIRAFPPRGSWNEPVTVVGYVCEETTRQELPCGNVLVFHLFHAIADAGEALLSAGIRPLPLGNNHRHLWAELSLALRAQADQNGHQKPKREHNYTESREAREVCSRLERQFQDVRPAANPLAIGPTPAGMDQFFRESTSTVAENGRIFYVKDRSGLGTPSTVASLGECGSPCNTLQWCETQF